MCLRSSESFPDTRTPTMRSASCHNKRNVKTQTHLRVLNLTRRRRILREKKEMEMRNMKLFLKNQSIIRENEALKKRALVLCEENNVLFSASSRTLPVPSSFL
ncbi:hypothetical protein Bca52824_082559 [Brassica carinata]|uniref:Uncharacterized protein n=1 Tax=Brassica carinata TaxID=52824 RepID=A0A8X7PKJ2_BRACI|nr:hypothetical protein Bca52824_082559 [Brassica carinata]